MKSYQEAQERLGERQSRKLENNTYLQRREDGALAVKLHHTDVVTYHPDGRIILNSGGWRTVTTKDRLNSYSPVNIWTDKGIWYVGSSWQKPAQAYFDDGMIVNPDGSLSGVKTLKEMQAELKLREQVRRYAAGYMKALTAGKVPAPSGGDCWDCCMMDQKTGKTLGELSHSDHLKSHIKEKYYVPSLAVNALKAMGGSRAAESTLWFHFGHKQAGDWGDFAREQIGKAIKRYMYRELGLAY